LKLAMEIKLSLLMLLVLAAIGASLVAGTPEPLLPHAQAAASELERLEDAYAADHADAAVATALASEYLRVGRPALTIGVVAQASPGLMRDPMLTRRLAQAYEAVGRLDDALLTARVARARCASGASAALGPGNAPSGRCSAGALVALEQHEAALIWMLRWGVEDPRFDPRSRLAHRLAARNATILSAQLER
jgi:hypothetical protein